MLSTPEDLTIANCQHAFIQAVAMTGDKGSCMPLRQASVTGTSALPPLLCCAVRMAMVSLGMLIHEVTRSLGCVVGLHAALGCASRMSNSCCAGHEGADGGLDAGESFGVGAVHARAASTILVGRTFLMCILLPVSSIIKGEHNRALQISCSRMRW